MIFPLETHEIQGVEPDSVAGILVLGEEGGRRGLVGIRSCSVGNCKATSCLVVASNLFFFLNV